MRQCRFRNEKRMELEGGLTILKALDARKLGRRPTRPDDAHASHATVAYRTGVIARTRRIWPEKAQPAGRLWQVGAGETRNDAFATTVSTMAAMRTRRNRSDGQPSAIPPPVRWEYLEAADDSSRTRPVVKASAGLSGERHSRKSDR